MSAEDLVALGVAFASEYHDHIVRMWEGHQLPRIESKIVFTDDGYHTATPGDTSWHAVVYAAAAAAWQTLYADALCHSLRKMGLPRSIADPPSIDWSQLREFILREGLPPIVETYAEIDALRFDKAIAETKWERWIDNWSASEEVNVIYVLLD